MSETPTELCRIPRANGRQIVVRRNRHEGATFVDVREFSPDTTAGPGLPTDGGLCFTSEEWRELLRTLTAELLAGAVPLAEAEEAGAA